VVSHGRVALVAATDGQTTLLELEKRLAVLRSQTQKFLLRKSLAMDALFIPQVVGASAWSGAIVVLVKHLTGFESQEQRVEQDPESKAPRPVTSDSWSFALLSSLSATGLACAFCEKFIEYDRTILVNGEIKVDSALQVMLKSSEFFFANLWLGLFVQSLVAFAILYDFMVARVVEAEVRQAVVDLFILGPFFGLSYIFEGHILPLEATVSTYSKDRITPSRRVELVHHLEMLSVETVLAIFLAFILMIAPVIRYHLAKPFSAKVFVQVVIPKTSHSERSGVAPATTEQAATDTPCEHPSQSIEMSKVTVQTKVKTQKSVSFLLPEPKPEHAEPDVAHVMQEEVAVVNENARQSAETNDIKESEESDSKIMLEIRSETTERVTTVLSSVEASHLSDLADELEAQAFSEVASAEVTARTVLRKEVPPVGNDGAEDRTASVSESKTKGDAPSVNASPTLEESEVSGNSKSAASLHSQAPEDNTSMGDDNSGYAGQGSLSRIPKESSAPLPKAPQEAAKDDAVPSKEECNEMAATEVTAEVPVESNATAVHARKDVEEHPEINDTGSQQHTAKEDDIKPEPTPSEGFSPKTQKVETPLTSFSDSAEKQDDLVMGSSLCVSGLALSFWILRSLK